ncbi:MAG: hypothetical protein H7247_05950 [Polaromonas sp.]|nr:hypothetical protein [Gemmatimonadaceae bacterium]
MRSPSRAVTVVHGISVLLVVVASLVSAEESGRADLWLAISLVSLSMLAFSIPIPSLSSIAFAVVTFTGSLAISIPRLWPGRPVWSDDATLWLFLLCVGCFIAAVVVDRERADSGVPDPS